MRLNSLSLPHPVLGIGDDVNGSYSVECLATLTHEKANISVKHILINKTLTDMINAGEAFFNVEIHCRQTIFRMSYTSDKFEYDIEIPIEKLRNKVDVNFYVVSSTDKEDYHIEGENSDYGDNKFIIQKGDVLASGGKTWFPALKDWRALKAADSFMTITEGAQTDGPANIDLDDNKIRLELCKKDYSLYSNLCRRSELFSIFHSSFVFPVLVYALTKIKDGGKEYENYQWFIALNFRKDNEEELSNIDWSNEQNIPKVVQILLSDPINRMLNSSEKLIDTGSEE